MRKRTRGVDELSLNLIPKGKVSVFMILLLYNRVPTPEYIEHFSELFCSLNEPKLPIQSFY